LDGGGFRHGVGWWLGFVCVQGKPVIIGLNAYIKP